MVAVGVSAISAVGGTYSQNDKTLASYYVHLDQGKLPIARGIGLNADDLLRRSIIGQLMCDFELSFASVQLPEGTSFASYFAPELEKIRQLELDGLLTINEHGLLVSLKGRLLIRNVCMVFDRYLSAVENVGPLPLRYSKTI